MYWVKLARLSAPAGRVREAACSSGSRNRGPSGSTSSTPEVASAPSHSRT